LRFGDAGETGHTRSDVRADHRVDLLQPDLPGGQEVADFAEQFLRAFGGRRMQDGGL
jgi:hypothetical protein